MLKRLVLGLLIGGVIGAALAFALLKGLALTLLVGAGGALIAYAAAAIGGALTGLIAGKPIWSADGKIEAGLKAFFGALLATAGMFALRQWAVLPLDLSALGGGAGQWGMLPLATLPLLTAVLGGFFELDNTNTGDTTKSADTKKGTDARARIAEGKRVANGSSLDAELDEDIDVVKKAKR